MANTSLVILDTLKDLEIAVSELYLSLATKYSNHYEFFWNLSLEEQNHASRIEQYLAYVRGLL
jgi:ferritin